MRALFLQEFRLSLRTGGRISLAVVFYFAFGLLVPLGIGPDLTVHELAAPGVLWVGALLSSLLTLDKILTRDHDDGTLERLMVASLPAEALVTAKGLAHWILVCSPLCIASPFVGLLLNLDFSTGLKAAATLAVGTPAISAIGVFVAAMTLGLKRGHLLQATLIIPACIPALIFGSSAVASLAVGNFPEQQLAALAAVSLATTAISPLASAMLLRLNVCR